MRSRRLLTFTLAGLLIAAHPRAHAEDNTLQYQYLKIYLKINDADQLEKQGNYAGALADFKDCYTRLQRIHNSDPSWESALVIQRMNDCRSKIIDLTERAAQTVEPADATPPTPGPSENSGNSFSATPTTSGDVTVLRQKLVEVEKELSDTKAKLQNSQIEVTTLRSQLDTVNQQLTALKSEQTEDKQVGRLLSENKSLSDKLAAAQKEIASIKSPNPRSAVSLLRVQLKNTQDKLDASEAANTALQQTTTTLRQQLDDAQADLRADNQRLASTPSNAPGYDTLKRENEVMRQILTRELQEQAHRDMAKRLAQEEFDRLRLTSKVLQEQLDILGSPMTPPTSEQERSLLEGLRMAGTQVAPVPPEGGNGFSATQGTNAETTASAPGISETNAPSTVATTGDTNAPGSAAPATNAPSNVETAATTNAPGTNAPPSQVASADTNNPAATAPLTNRALAEANSSVPPVTPPSPDSVTPAGPPPSVTPTTGTNTVSTTPDNSTNSASTTNTASSNSPGTTNLASTPASPGTTNSPSESPTNSVASTAPTNSPTAEAPSTNSASATPSVASGTNSETAPASPTNTASTATPPTTNMADQAATNAPPTTPPAAADAAEYASKPRLPDDMRDTAQQAADLFKMQRYDDAAAKYQDIIEKYPDSLYAWSNLGVVRFQQGKLPEALKALQQAVKLSPTDAFSYSNLGIVYYQMNQYENAISALERALALDPANAKSHNYLGCACSQKGWQEVAEKEFLKAIEIDDTFGDAHFNLALVYATEKPPALEMARRHYKRALELGISPDPRLEKLLQMDGVAQNPTASDEK